MSTVFRRSDKYTIGIEMEVQLVGRDSLALVPSSKEIIDSLEGLGGAVKPEFFMSNLEINTKVCSNIDEAETDLRRKFGIVIDEAARHDSLLCCAGSHPFSHWKDQVVTEDERYRRLMDRLQMVSRRFNIFGLHVHIGVGEGDKCIYIMNRLLFYLPHLLALSANSPFWNGENTGLKSYRVKVFESLPTAGLPFYFNDWQDYSILVNNYIATGTIDTIREIWWDVRPHPDFGTIEVRICDAPSTIREVLAIASLIQALVARLGRDYDRGITVNRLHSSVIRQNKWRAARYGLDGEFITEGGNETIPVRESIKSLLSLVEGEAAGLGCREYLFHVDEILDMGEGAVRQIEEWRRYGDVRRVVRHLAESLKGEVDSRVRKESLR